MRKRRVLRAAVAGALSMAALTLPAAAASAKPAGGPKVWVNATAAVGSNTSCTNPGFTSIQAAVAIAQAESGTVEVCAGTYVEQLDITGNISLVANGAVTIQLPAAPADSTTSCDQAVVASGGQAPQDEISICNATVSMLGDFTVSAFFPNVCYDSLYAIFVGQGSSFSSGPAVRGGPALKIAGAGVPVGASDTGCQGGVGVEVGWSPASACPGNVPGSQVASAAISGATITGYQKSGIVATSVGSTLSVSSTTITGRGDLPSTNIAENGIEVDCGAVGTLSGVNVSANECDVVAQPACGPDFLNQTQSSGVLFYEPGAGSTLTRSTISNNDMGVYYQSSAAALPVTPDVALSGNKLIGNRDVGLGINYGTVSSTKDTIIGPGGVGVGIDVLQYAGQPYGVSALVNHDTITGEYNALELESDAVGAGDPAGSMSINHSKFLTGNTNYIANNSPGHNFTIAGLGNH